MPAAFGHPFICSEGGQRYPRPTPRIVKGSEVSIHSSRIREGRRVVMYFPMSIHYDPPFPPRQDVETFHGTSSLLLFLGTSTGSNASHSFLPSDKRYRRMKFWKAIFTCPFCAHITSALSPHPTTRCFSLPHNEDVNSPLTDLYRIRESFYPGNSLGESFPRDASEWENKLFIRRYDYFLLHPVSPLLAYTHLIRPSQRISLDRRGSDRPSHSQRGDCLLLHRVEATRCPPLDMSLYPPE